MTTATITEADKRAAHALLVEHFGSDGGVNVFLRDRIARIAADARAEENRACEAIATDIAEAKEAELGYYGSRAAACDEIADAIAKRRGGE